MKKTLPSKCCKLAHCFKKVGVIMRSNFVLTVEDSKNSLSTLSLYCCLRQAQKCFDSLAFALPMNKKGYQRLTLSIEGSDGLLSVVNTATFRGV